MGAESGSYVRLYSKRSLEREMASFFEVLEVKKRHLFLQDIFSSMGGLVPRVYLRALEQYFGWYLVATGRKPVEGSLSQV